MARDLKYGKVTTERGSIGEDEPVLVLRAQDRAAPAAILEYALVCAEMGSPAEHVDLVMAAAKHMTEWQAEHATKVPDSAAPAAPETGGDDA